MARKWDFAWVPQVELSGTLASQSSIGTTHIPFSYQKKFRECYVADKAEYERNAEACLRMAEKAQTAEERAQLLAMAQAWRRLATAAKNLRNLKGEE